MSLDSVALEWSSPGAESSFALAPQNFAITRGESVDLVFARKSGSSRVITGATITVRFATSDKTHTSKKISAVVSGTNFTASLSDTDTTELRAQSWYYQAFDETSREVLSFGWMALLENTDLADSGTAAPLLSPAQPLNSNLTAIANLAYVALGDALTSNTLAQFAPGGAIAPDSITATTLVSATGTFSGTMSGFVLDAGGQQFNVKAPQYGAIGNDTANDSTAINLASLACHNAGGGDVFFPPGTYKVTTQLNTYDNVRFVGCGWASNIHATLSGDLFVGTNKSNLVFVNLRITGAYSRGISLTNPTNARIRDCFISGATVNDSVQNSAGIWIKGCSDVWIENNYLSGNGIGHSADRGSDIEVYLDPAVRVHINGNTCVSTAVHFNIMTSNISNSEIVGNTCANAIEDGGISGYGILIYKVSDVDTCTDNVIAGNTVRDVAGIGIYNQAADYTTITGNVLRNTCTTISPSLLPAAAIGINGGLHVTVTGNTIYNSVQDGIALSYVEGVTSIGHHATITGNSINGTLGTGAIRVRGNWHYTVIGNNAISNSAQSGIIFYGATGSIHGCSVDGNIITTTGGNNAGIAIIDVTNDLRIVNNTVVDASGRGIFCTGGGTNVIIQGNLVKNCSLGSPGTYQGIYFDTTGTTVSDNKILSDTSDSNLTFGVYDASAGTDNYVVNNVSKGHTVAEVGAANPTVTKIFNNNFSLHEVSGVLTSDLPFAGTTGTFGGGISSVGLTNVGGFNTKKTAQASGTATNIATFSINASGTPTAGFGSIVNFAGENSTTDDHSMASITTTYTVVTAGAERVRQVFSVACGDGSLHEVMRFQGGGAAPNFSVFGAAGTGQLSAPDINTAMTGFGFWAGSGTLGYANLTGSTAPLASGFVHNWNSGDVLLTHSAGTLTVTSSQNATVLTVQNAAVGGSVAVNITSAAGNWQFGTDNAGNGTGGNQLYWYQGGYRLTIQNGGNVGINTTAPTESLHVVGNIKATGSISIGGGTTITKALSASATLDFGNTSAQSSADLTIALTGAVVGDSVLIGTPAAPDTNTSFTGFVSAADTVTIRFNNYSSGSVNPASGTYRASVIRF